MTPPCATQISSDSPTKMFEITLHYFINNLVITNKVLILHRNQWLFETRFFSYCIPTIGFIDLHIIIAMMHIEVINQKTIL